MFQADNIELKHCFNIAKDLYESLKRLERKREHQSPLGVSLASKRIKARDRARSYPFEYYHFQDGEIFISIAYTNQEYKITTTSWYSRRYPNAHFDSFSNSYAIDVGKNFDDAVDFWRNVVEEYLTHSIGLF